MSGMVRARVELERWQAEKTGLLREAAQGLTDEALNMLAAHHPDMYAKLIEVLEVVVRGRESARSSMSDEARLIE